jgi:hypothetical protein
MQLWDDLQVERTSAGYVFLGLEPMQDENEPVICVSITDAEARALSDRLDEGSSWRSATGDLAVNTVTRSVTVSAGGSTQLSELDERAFSRLREVLADG